MPRLIEKLTDLKIRQAKAPGRYSDGEGLYLQVTRASDGARLNRSWVVRVRVRVLDAHGALRSQMREMGLGRFPAVGLAEARAKAKSARALAERGEDPITAERERVRARLQDMQRAAAAAARAMSFEQCAEAYVSSHKAQWRNAKHAKQWTATLKTYAYPVFGGVAVSDVDVGMVTKVLDPIWTTRAETARRLRGRIEAVLDWATVRGHRSGENPARWKGHLQKALPPRPKAGAGRHLAALPFDAVGAFMQELRDHQGVAARALEFAILTAARTGEVIGARWEELDLKKALWTIPAERMKGGREHRVPLSKQALALLLQLQSALGQKEQAGSVFSTDGQRPLSNMAMLMMLRRMKRDDLTVHGFRSTFRDWAAECTGFAGEVAEAALAHAIGNKVEAAYRRGDLFEKRRRLMQAWGDHCETQTSPKVISLHAET